MVRALSGICAALALCGVLATAAAGATLKVTVAPTTVHRNQTYTITITGRYRLRPRHRTRYLLAFIQYSGAACRPTATAEYALPMRDWSWVFYPQQGVRRSPFKRVFYQQARTKFGERRICAYLYERQVVPRTTARPVARAGAAFREVAK